MAVANCPHCGISLQGEPIPQKYIDEGYYSPGTTHYRRDIGYSAHDHTQFFICPDCAGTWPRWQEDHRLFALAERLRLAFDARGARI